MNLNDKERAILVELEENPYLTQQELSEMIELSRSATANLLSKLQEKGYILGKPYFLNKSQFVTCVGGANMDHKYMLKEAFVEKTSNPVHSKTSYGGVIRNVAENLGRLDINVSLMTLVGADMPGESLIEYSKHSMHVYATERLTKENTGSYIAVIDKNGNMIMGFADMDICDRMDRQWILNHKGNLRSGEWIICDCNIMKDAMETLVEISRENERKLVIVGVSSPKMKNVPENIQGIELVIANKDESQTYFRTNEENVEKLCELWIEKGVKQAVVTAGSEDFAYGDMKKGIFKKIVKPVEHVVDVTGAGDSFSAGVIFGLIRGEFLEKAVRYGIVNSAKTIQSQQSVRSGLTSLKLFEEEKEYYE